MYRYTVKQLLDHEFFAEGDVKVEVISKSDEGVKEVSKKENIMFRMEVPNHENKKNGQESVEFSYNLHSDMPEYVVEEMVSETILYLSIYLSIYHLSIYLPLSIHNPLYSITSISCTYLHT